MYRSMFGFQDFWWILIVWLQYTSNSKMKIQQLKNQFKQDFLTIYTVFFSMFQYEDVKSSSCFVGDMG